MKKVICYLDESTNMLYAGNSTSSLYLTVAAAPSDLEEAQPETAVVNNVITSVSAKALSELISSGLTTDDIINLRKGGII